MTETGTEKRLDEMSKRIDDLRSEMSNRIDDLRSEMHRGFDRVEGDVREMRADMKAGFDSLHRLIIVFFASTLGSIIAGVVVTILSHS